jgi:hypothetical protein
VLVLQDFWCQSSITNNVERGKVLTGQINSTKVANTEVIRAAAVLAMTKAEY